MVDTDSSVADMTGSSPRFSNSGANVYLKDGSTIVDMVTYDGAALQPGDPWSGDPVPGVSEGKLLHRAFVESDLDAAGTIHFVADTDTAADWHQGSEWRTTREFRRGQVFLGLPTWTGSATVTAYTMPDSGFSVITDLIDNASTSIDIQIYEFQSYQLYQKISDALSRGVNVRLYLEGTPVGGLADQSKWVAKELANEGAEVMLITSSAGWKRYAWTHSKFGIFDGQKVFVQSENWKQTGTPADSSYGNRGWGVVVQHAGVVDYFQDVFVADWAAGTSPDTYICQANVTDICSPPTSFTLDQSIPTGSYPAPYNSQTFTGTFTITPVMAPDHGLLKSRATRCTVSIRMSTA